MGKRGRPPKPTAAADRIIGLTVHRLSLWGFPLRSRDGSEGICEAVGAIAQTLAPVEAGITRHSLDPAESRPLGPDRVEQLYEAWRKAEQRRRQKANDWPLMARWRFEKSSLIRLRPRSDQSLRKYAVALLANGGEWPKRRRPSRLPFGWEPGLTGKAEKELALMPRVTRRKTG